MGYLDRVTSGPQPRPYRVLIYGVEGIGKSTFAANAPDPIFLGTEDGTAHLDVQRLPAPESFEDVRGMLRELREAEHGFRTLVVDTVDWLEPIIWQQVCKEGGQPNIEAFGYGKGYVAALDLWREFVADLERLQREREMHVVLVGHSQIKPFRNPQGDDFDRYELKLHRGAAGLLKEWVEDLLFAQYETLAVEDRKTRRVKGVSTGARLIYTVRTAAYDAKNRHDLPDALPLDWDEFDRACQAGRPADPAELREAIRDALARLAETDREKAEAALGRAGDDAKKLAQLLSWCRAKMEVME